MAPSTKIGRSNNPERGITLLELIIAIAILMVLMGAATPVVRVNLQRQREADLRRDLWEMRAAIERYKFIADNQGFQISVDSYGFPKDLDVLSKVKT